MPTILAPSYDGTEYSAPTFGRAKYIYAPQLDGQFGRGGTLRRTGTTDVVTLTVNGVEMPTAFDRTFNDQLTDTGTFSFSLLRDEFLATTIDFDDEVLFRRNGKAVFLGLVEDLSHTSLSQGEEVEHVVTISGRGIMAEFEDHVVQPSRGPGALPIEDVRTYSWVSTDFSATGAGWPNAKVVNSVRSYAGTGAPRPHIFPNQYGYWIWSNYPGVTSLDAPQGINLFRQVFTLADITTVRFFFAGDNVMRIWIDGVEIVWFAGSATPMYVDIELSAGGHVIGAKVANKTDVPGEPNPAGFILAGYTVTADGLLDDLIVQTNSNWKVLPYPVRAPGFTVGRVLRLLMNEAGMSNWTRDFTDTLDSNGNPWTYQREINLNVGRSLLESFKELMDAHADIAAAPGARVLRAWNRGTRGRTTTVTFQQTTNRNTSDFIALSHQGTRTRMNKALIRYMDGHSSISDSGSIGTHGVREKYVEMGHITDEDVAEDMVRSLMENRSEPAFSTTGTLLPRSSLTTPYDAFEIGDWVTCPNEENVNELMRVSSLGWVEDENGAVEYPITLRDQRLEIEEYQAVVLQRMAMGYAVGGARVSSRKDTPSTSAQRVTVLKVAEFSYDNSQLKVSASQRRPAEQSGNIIEIVGELTTAGTTTTTVLITKNGTTIGTLTFPPGATEASVPVDIVPVIANVSKIQVSVTAAGTGAKGLDVQVRGI